VTSAFCSVGLALWPALDPEPSPPSDGSVAVRVGEGVVVPAALVPVVVTPFPPTGGGCGGGGEEDM